MSVESQRTPFWARCGVPECSHTWIVVYLSMEMEKAGRAMSQATCPMCGENNPLVAGQAGGQLRHDVTQEARP